jgi:cobyric acid synthase
MPLGTHLAFETWSTSKTAPRCADGQFADALQGVGAAEGATSPDGRLVGTYIHGLFAADAQRSAWLARLGAGEAAVAHDALIESTLDRLAAHVARHADLDRLLSLSR